MERFGAGWQRAFEWPFFQSLLPPVAGRRVLAIAQRDFAHPRVAFQRAAIEDVHFEGARFDLVVSSLAFHYVADYARLVQRIGRWLAPRGTLVFSTEHPLYTARLPDLGWVLDNSGARRGWAIDRYAEAGERTERWFVEGVRKYHRPISGLVTRLIEAGLRLEGLLEPVADAAWVAAHPDAADESRRPMFLLLRASAT